MANDKNDKPAVPGFTAEQTMALVKMLSDAMKDGVTEAVAKAMVMQESMRLKDQENQNKAENEFRARREKSDCPKCGMPFMSCGGPEYVAHPIPGDDQHMEMKPGEDKNHVMMVVYLDDPDEEAFFDGIHFNGRRFKSNGPNHLIAVPRSAPIAHTLSVHYDQLRQMRRTRRGVRQVGALTPQGVLAPTGPTSFTSWSR